jgi:hypothetical protein
VTLISQALEIADSIAEPLVAAHLSTALIAAERRLEEHIPQPD